MRPYDDLQSRKFECVRVVFLNSRSSYCFGKVRMVGHIIEGSKQGEAQVLMRRINLTHCLYKEDYFQVFWMSWKRTKNEILSLSRTYIHPFYTYMRWGRFSCYWYGEISVSLDQIGIVDRFKHWNNFANIWVSRFLVPPVRSNVGEIKRLNHLLNRKV